ncbi:MAG: hypothetical protein QM811_18000 [Pirellulales bacterium]
MTTIAGWICDALRNTTDDALHGRIRAEVFDLGRQFPVPANRTVATI